MFFPLEVSECKDVTLETHPLPPITTVHEEVITMASERTASVSGSTSTDSDRTPVRVDSQDSQVSDTETITDGHRWPRQNSVSTIFLLGLFCESAIFMF